MRNCSLAVKMVEMNDWDMDQEGDEDWGIEESWDDPPELMKNSSSINEGVYQTNKLNRGFTLSNKPDVIKKQQLSIAAV